MWKVVDTIRHGNNNTLEPEIRAYATLQLLKGHVLAMSSPGSMGTTTLGGYWIFLLWR
jgi:hypothetical protein